MRRYLGFGRVSRSAPAPADPPAPLASMADRSRSASCAVILPCASISRIWRRSSFMAFSLPEVDVHGTAEVLDLDVGSFEGRKHLAEDPERAERIDEHDR